MKRANKATLRAGALILGAMVVWLGASVLLSWWYPKLLVANAWIVSFVIILMMAGNLFDNSHTRRRAKRYREEGTAAFDLTLILSTQILHGHCRSEERADGYRAVTCRCGEMLGIVKDEREELDQMVTKHVDRKLADLRADAEAKQNEMANAG